MSRSNVHKLFNIWKLLLIFIVFPFSAHATVTYVPTTSLSFVKNSPHNAYYGAHVGTVIFTDEPQNALDFVINTSDMGIPFTVTYVFIDPTTGAMVETETTPSKIFISYYGMEGSSSVPKTVTSSNLGALNIIGLDTNYPVLIYLLIQNGNYNPVMNNSEGSLYYIETETGFSVIDEEGNNLLIIGGDSVEDESVPIIGGGIPGPDGEGSITVGDVGTNNPPPVVELPLYLIQFSESEVTFDLSQATLEPMALSTIQLSIPNFSTAFFGVGGVHLRLYQEGYPDFYLIHQTFPGFRIPFSLWWMNPLSTIEPNATYSPWGTTILQENYAQIGISVTASAYDNQIAGNYSATITVEVFSDY